MSDETNKIGQDALLRTLKIGSSSTGSTGTTSTKGGGIGSVGKDEFLTMLVTQLKNQDPMDPMKSDDFAVNLAQFSQLEQLISINEKIGSTGQAGSDSDASSLAGLLGREVTINSDSVQVKNHDGGRVRFSLDNPGSNVKVELLNSDGSVVETVEAGDLSAGRHSLALGNLTTESGEFQVRVTGQSSSGDSLNPIVNAAGIVTGFRPGDNPVLLLGDREVKPDEIVEVNAVS